MTTPNDLPSVGTEDARQLTGVFEIAGDRNIAAVIRALVSERDELASRVRVLEAKPAQDAVDADEPLTDDEFLSMIDSEGLVIDPCLALSIKAIVDRAAVEAALRDAPQAEGWVLVPVDVLKAASESLGSFVSDHGWGDADMQAMDNLDAYLAARPSAPTAVEPDERAEFEAWWATMNEAPYYPGIQKRIAEHAFKAGRASKGKPT